MATRARARTLGVVLLRPQSASVATPFLSREEIIRLLFMEGFQYQVILCFLTAVFGVCISMRTLKRILKKQHLRRRGDYSNLQNVGRYLMVHKLE